MKYFCHHTKRENNNDDITLVFDLHWYKQAETIPAPKVDEEDIGDFTFTPRTMSCFA